MFLIWTLAGIGAWNVARAAWKWAGSHPNQVAAREATRRRTLIQRLIGNNRESE